MPSPEPPSSLATGHARNKKVRGSRGCGPCSAAASPARRCRRGCPSSAGWPRWSLCCEGVLRRPRPGRLWLFFYGRRRRGFPGLLAGLLVLLGLLALTFAIPGAAELSRRLGLLPVGLVALLLLAALGVLIFGRRRR